MPRRGCRRTCSDTGSVRASGGASPSPGSGATNAVVRPDLLAPTPKTPTLRRFRPQAENTEPDCSSSRRYQLMVSSNPSRNGRKGRRPSRLRALVTSLRMDQISVGRSGRAPNSGLMGSPMSSRMVWARSRIDTSSPPPMLNTSPSMPATVAARMGFAEINESLHVDGAETVAVGCQKSLAQCRCAPDDSARGPRVLPGVDHLDVPSSWQFGGEAGDEVGAVSGREDELLKSLSGVDVHHVEEDRRIAHLHQRLGQLEGMGVSPSPLAPAENQGLHPRSTVTTLGSARRAVTAVSRARPARFSSTPGPHRQSNTAEHNLAFVVSAQVCWAHEPLTLVVVISTSRARK